jgi:DNA-binding transcriptional LysR family regulator|nr:LysR family transcriptional regulator substrate-binding protein [Colwellia sp. MB02u-6]
MMGYYYFPKILTTFKQKHPKIKIYLVDQDTAALEKMLLNGESNTHIINERQVLWGVK